MIEYQERPDGKIDVRLERRRIGVIERLASGFRYRTNSGSHGETFPTLGAVKASLEED